MEIAGEFALLLTFVDWGPRASWKCGEWPPARQTEERAAQQESEEEAIWQVRHAGHDAGQTEGLGLGGRGQASLSDRRETGRRVDRPPLQE